MRAHEEIDELDRITRTPVNIYGGLHPCSGINRRHVPRIKGITYLGHMENAIFA